MSEENWFILIYETADAASQELLAGRLKAMGGLTVQTAQNNGEYVVVIENEGTTDALTLHELVVALDANVELVSTHKAAPADSAVALERQPS